MLIAVTSPITTPLSLTFAPIGRFNTSWKSACRSYVGPETACGAGSEVSDGGLHAHSTATVATSASSAQRRTAWRHVRAALT